MNIINIIFILLIILYVECKSGYLFYSDFNGKPYNVTYNKRAVLLNGEPSLFIAGSIHYPRFSEGMWEDMIIKSKEDGLNLIQIYIFWNYHEEFEGQFKWDGNADFLKFIELAGKHGLFVNMRIGPYVCAEWQHGGIPIWLKLKQGVTLRSANTIFTTEMTRFVKLIVDKSRYLMADRGGPIIMSQIENELQWHDQSYLNYLENLVNELNLPIPFVMCQGETTKNTISACNGNDGEAFLYKGGENGRIFVDQPGIFTENEGWFQNWGEYYPDYGGHGAQFASRTTEDLALSVVRWFARGGSYMNYYMYFGGNNFGKWAGSSITNMYADTVNYHHDNLPNEPKHSHLNKLHYVIQNISEILINDEPQIKKDFKVKYWNGKSFVYGKEQWAHQYNYNGHKVSFIENSAGIGLLVEFDVSSFYMAAHSVLIYNHDSQSILYNTTDITPAKVTKTYTIIQSQPFPWKIWKEQSLTRPIESLKGKEVIHAKSPWGQLEQTLGLTEYFYYEVNITFTFSHCFTSIGGHMSNAYTFYVDGNLTGEVSDRMHFHGPSYPSLTLQNPSGLHRMTVLSETLGIDNLIRPDIPIPIGYGLNTLDVCGLIVTNYNWIMRTHLDGELLEIYTEEGSKNVQWKDYTQDANTGGVWYKATFPTPQLKSNEELVIDLGGMCRGHMYINGIDLGRFFLINGKGQDTPTQKYYFIPKDWLYTNGKENSIALFDVCKGMNPLSPRLNSVKMV